MKPRLLFWTVGLVAALMAASCAPAETAPPPAPQAESNPATAEPASPSAPEATALPQTEQPQVQAVATSRGPDLHATDPTTVSLAAGQLQLVEFFRFT